MSALGTIPEATSYATFVAGSRQGGSHEDGEELDGIVALSFEPTRIAGLEVYCEWYRWREDGVSDAA